MQGEDAVHGAKENESYGHGDQQLDQCEATVALWGWMECPPVFSPEMFHYSATIVLSVTLCALPFHENATATSMVFIPVTGEFEVTVHVLV